jgi:hypothetical protein
VVGVAVIADVVVSGECLMHVIGEFFCQADSEPA